LSKKDENVHQVVGLECRSTKFVTKMITIMKELEEKWTKIVMVTNHVVGGGVEEIAQEEIGMDFVEETKFW